MSQVQSSRISLFTLCCRNERITGLDERLGCVDRLESPGNIDFRLRPDRCKGRLAKECEESTGEKPTDGHEHRAPPPDPLPPPRLRGQPDEPTPLSRESHWAPHVEGRSSAGTCSPPGQ